MNSFLDKISTGLIYGPQYLASSLGYTLGLPGLGVSQQFGTPYSAERTPSSVYKQNYFPTQIPQHQVNTMDLPRTGSQLPQIDIGVKEAAPSARPANSSSNFMDYYGGWGEPEAKADFQNQFGGDINRLRDARGGGGGGGGGQPSQPAQPNMEEILRRQAEARLGQARNVYDERSALLRNQLGDVGREKDSLLDRISGTYANVKQQAKDTLAKNVGALERGKQDVTSEYANLKTEASRLLGDTQLRNRLMARSLGSLNSSFYENLQSKAALNTQNSISKISQQEQSQLDKIGQEIISQNTDTNTKLQNLEETEAAAKTDVLNKYQSLFNSIQTQLGFNEKGKADALEAINNEMQSSLDKITYTMSLYKEQAAATTGVSNPIKDITEYAKMMSAINSSGLNQAAEDTNLLAEAQASYNANPGNYDNIVGYLEKVNPRVLFQFQNSVPQSTGLFGLGGRGKIESPVQPQAVGQFGIPKSLLDLLFQ